MWEVHTEILHGCRIFIPEQCDWFALYLLLEFLSLSSTPELSVVLWRKFTPNINMKYLIESDFVHPKPSIHLGQLHTI